MGEYEKEKIQLEIDKFVCKANNSTEKGNLFCKWILTYLFEQSEDEIDEMCAIDGKNDNSIDAYFEEGKTLKIIQTKYNSSHDWAQITKFLSDIKRILRNPDDFVGQNPLLYDVSEKIRNYKEDDKYIELYYITSQVFSKEERTKLDVELKKFEEEFENDFEKVTLQVIDLDGIKEFIDISLDIIPQKYKNKSTRLILKNHFISNITCVAEVELKHFANFVKANKDYLFYSNIRNYLKSTPVNKGIIETFKNKPTDFWYFNNGITVVCDDFEIKGNGILDIVTPQIVNGCQTANTILKEYIELKDKEKQNNLQGTILIKVIKDKNRNKKDEITQYTNRQNSVSGKDFFALDKFQKKMVKEFEKLGYFYEIQNKSSIAKTKTEMLKFKGVPSLRYLFDKKFNNILPVKVVVQTYAAGMHFMPGTASSRSGELMVYGKKWSKIFNDDTHENPLYWLYPFAIMNYAKCYLDYTNKSIIPYKRYSLMFYVACYFRTLVYIFKSADIIDNLANVNPLQVDIKSYTLVFENSITNKEILEFVDEVIKRFMKDKSITQMINSKYGTLDISNFMKSEVETNEYVRRTLDEFITEELAENPQLIVDVKKTFAQKIS